MMTYGAMVSHCPDPNCINPSSYTNQGILGEILERIRDELNNQSTTFEKMPISTSMPDIPPGDGDALHVETNPLMNQSALHVETPQPELNMINSIRLV